VLVLAIVSRLRIILEYEHRCAEYEYERPAHKPLLAPAACGQLLIFQRFDVLQEFFSQRRVRARSGRAVLSPRGPVSAGSFRGARVLNPLP
jgi:hypothetical protein